MTLTTINAQLYDSTGIALSGYLNVTLGSEVADALGAVYLPVPNTIALTSGAATFSLEPSFLTGTSYKFDIYQTTTTTVSGVTTTSDNLVYSFSAVVPMLPDTGKTLPFSSLFPAGVNNDTLNSTIYNIVRQLYSTPAFFTALQGSLFSGQGNWVSTQYYAQGNVVAYNGSSYYCVSNQPVINVPPTGTNLTPNVGAFWQLLASIGATGAGTTGSAVAYGSAWSGSLTAPSQGSLYAYLQALNSTLTSTYAPLASPTFTGVPIVPTASTGVSTGGTQAANTGWVSTYFAPLAAPAFTTSGSSWPTSVTPTTTDNSTKLATTAFVQSNLAGYATTSSINSTYAPLASPVFTGSPTVPTAPTSTNTTQAASTAFVQSNLANYAPLASPALTGTPTVPTATTTDNSTKAASTAFVQSNLAVANRPAWYYKSTTSGASFGTTPAAVPYNVAVYDTLPGLSGGAFNTNSTSAGYYFIQAAALVNPSVLLQAYMEILVNGSIVFRNAFYVAASANYSLSVAGLYLVPASGTVQIYVYTSTGTASLSTDSTFNYFTGFRVNM